MRRAASAVRRRPRRGHQHRCSGRRGPSRSPSRWSPHRRRKCHRRMAAPDGAAPLHARQGVTVAPSMWGMRLQAETITGRRWQRKMGPNSATSWSTAWAKPTTCPSSVMTGRRNFLASIRSTARQGADVVDAGTHVARVAENVVFRSERGVLAPHYFCIQTLWLGALSRFQIRRWRRCPFPFYSKNSPLN